MYLYQRTQVGSFEKNLPLKYWKVNSNSTFEMDERPAQGKLQM